MNKSSCVCTVCDKIKITSKRPVNRFFAQNTPEVKVSIYNEKQKFVFTILRNFPWKSWYNHVFIKSAIGIERYIHTFNKSHEKARRRADGIKFVKIEMVFTDFYFYLLLYTCYTMNAENDEQLIWVNHFTFKYI